MRPSPQAAYLLSLPERAARSLAAVSGGLLREIGNVALPAAVRRTTLYHTMVDVALALLGRLNQHLQLLTLAFPAKMLAALLILSWMVSLFPRLMLEFSGQAWTAAGRVLGL